MLGKVLYKLIAESDVLEHKEMDAKQAYDMLIQDSNAQLGQPKADVWFESETKANKLQAKATAEGDVAFTTTSREEDQKYWNDLTATSELMGSEFEARQQLRAEELAVAKFDTAMTRRLLWKEEANEEAEQKGRCDTELSTNELTRTENNNAVGNVPAEFDQFDEDSIEQTKAFC